MKPTATEEVHRVIFDDVFSLMFDVKPDPDGLNLVNLICSTYSTDDCCSKQIGRISMSPQAAMLIGRAIINCAKEEVKRANEFKS